MSISLPSTGVGPALVQPGLLGIEPSFGFGDRLGFATPGHLLALQEAGGAIRGIFAQQSIREMTRTNRTATEVMAAASDALSAAGFSDPWGADADHLKTQDDVRQTMAAGFVFFTLDPSGDVDQQADNYAPAELATRFEACKPFTPWLDAYRGKTVRFASGEIVFDEPTLARAAVKYGKAIQTTIALGRFVQEEAARLSKPCELELSVDETEQPTTPAEHYLIADQLRAAGVRLVSLAPRFEGDFEKGVDYKGDIKSLERSLRFHAEIAAEMGPYKLSLHSGSDKISMYRLLSRATEGRFHVKTAGTSYLEALRVVARCDDELFRRIIDFSRGCYDRDKATYHVSATLADAPPQAEVADPVELERQYLERWEDVPAGAGFTAPGRQILHCTFGSVMTDPELGAAVKDVLLGNHSSYSEVLRDHFVRHLDPLREG
ncbi:hypothetical protein Pla108_18060 [Botrimarina colliarenosi]|uniref:Tagaturonate/fructuronate epimerase n=1 Tax=Botrimarina colliarenosi TaxID=2528001 RepID=A0A5C6ACB5_9BACT|nr:tagaturonate epimerase family protein [Botrimarina colliarenosi]TWT97654.1 hypothetical protein Pla108_18060 [Botrimarina colliarenosi]